MQIRDAASRELLALMLLEAEAQEAQSRQLAALLAAPGQVLPSTGHHTAGTGTAATSVLLGESHGAITADAAPDTNADNMMEWGLEGEETAGGAYNTRADTARGERQLACQTAHQAVPAVATAAAASQAAHAGPVGDTCATGPACCGVCGQLRSLKGGHHKLTIQGHAFIGLRACE